MRKNVVSILIGLMMFGISGQAWAANVIAADLDCTNPAGCVQTSEISDGAVTNSKIATGAVATTNIAGGAVTTATIANGAVTDTQISGTISGSKLGVHTHNGSDIVDGTIGTSKISDGAVTTSKVVDGAVTTGKLADWSVNGSKIVDFSITDAKISSYAVSTTKIADGAVTDAKISGPISGAKLGAHTHNGIDITDGTVTASKISDGAITDAKITGPISASKLEKPANVVVVAKSGGDFTSIQSSIDSINPTAENPYLIKVMPGVYGEPINMKSFVNLQGYGPEITIIEGGITCNGIHDAVISGFTLRQPVGWTSGFYVINGATPTIIGNVITGYPYGGIQCDSSVSSPIIKGNTFTGNGIGIMGRCLSHIEGNSIVGNGTGIEGWVYGPTPIESNTIEGNTIMNNNIGIDIDRSTIIRNRIIGNGIDINGGRQSYISFNMFDTLTQNDWWTGGFNLKSDGTSW